MPAPAGKNFVLVHGAWHGGWCWRNVAAQLRQGGAEVFTPTQTGLGERAHLLNETIDIETFISDIQNHILAEDLTDVILVGHSFAGKVISGVADRIPQRLSRLIYLDAGIVYNGEAMMDQVPEEAARERIQQAEKSSGGLTMPVPPGGAFGLSRAEDIAWVERQATPHPLKTYLTPLKLQGPLANGLPADYVICTDPIYPALAEARRRLGELDWAVHELATGHDAMVSAPAPTAALLEKIAAG